MDDLVIALLLFFAVMFGLFFYGTIHYRRRFLEEETDKVIYRCLFIQLRDQGLESVVKHLNYYHYMHKYRNEIKQVDDQCAEYCSQ